MHRLPVATNLAVAAAPAVNAYSLGSWHEFPGTRAAEVALARAISSSIGAGPIENCHASGAPFGLNSQTGAALHLSASRIGPGRGRGLTAASPVVPEPGAILNSPRPRKMTPPTKRAGGI